MIEAADCIADLDEEIAATGQDIVLRRPVPNGADIEKPFRAHARISRPDDLEDGQQQSEGVLILSPTGLPAEFADTDDTRLQKNDRIVFDGRVHAVMFVERVRVADVLVRMNVTVRG